MSEQMTARDFVKLPASQASQWVSDTLALHTPGGIVNPAAKIPATRGGRLLLAAYQTHLARAVTILLCVAVCGTVYVSSSGIVAVHAAWKRSKQRKFVRAARDRASH